MTKASRTKLLLGLAAVLCGALAASASSMPLGDWAHTVQTVCTGLATFLTGWAAMRQPGTAKPAPDAEDEPALYDSHDDRPLT